MLVSQKLIWPSILSTRRDALSSLIGALWVKLIDNLMKVDDMNYDYTTLSTDGLRNVLGAKPELSRSELIAISEARLEAGDLDEIELILEESGE